MKTRLRTRIRGVVEGRETTLLRAPPELASQGSCAKWRGSRQPNNQTINHEGRRRLVEPVHVTRKPSSYGFRRANTLVATTRARKLGRNGELTPPFSPLPATMTGLVPLHPFNLVDRFYNPTRISGASYRLQFRNDETRGDGQLLAVRQ